MNPVVRLTAPLALPLIAGLVGCNATTAPRMGQQVAFRLAAAAPLTSATGPLSITSVRLVVGGAALGNGDQFGCVDCQNAGPEARAVPEVVSLPLDGRPVQLRTEEVQPGSYSMIEVEVVTPTKDLLVTPTGASGMATIAIAGTFDGRPFELGLPIEGTLREHLPTALQIGSGGAPSIVEVTLSLPVTSWFEGAGAILDPTAVPQRNLIEANARKSFTRLEKAGNENSR